MVCEVDVKIKGWVGLGKEALDFRGLKVMGEGRFRFGDSSNCKWEVTDRLSMLI